MPDAIQSAVEAALERLGTALLQDRDGRLRQALASGQLDPGAYLRELIQLLYRLQLALAAAEAGLPDAAAGAFFPPLFSPLAAPLGGEPDSAFLAALEPLARVRPTWDQLCARYERLLDRGLEVDVGARRVALAAASGGRRARGSYSTPSDLVATVLDGALDPVLERAAADADPEAAILGLRVLDAACGSGRFLVAAAQRIATRLAVVRTGEAEPSRAAMRTASREVVSRCLYGIDLDPTAAALCRATLWLAVGDRHLAPSVLEARVRCGNGLLGATPALVAQGIPDAAYQPRSGDEAAVARALARRNRSERQGETPFPKAVPSQAAADAWCAAFLLPKAAGHPAVTTAVLRLLEVDPRRLDPALAAAIRQVGAAHGLLHPHLAFPSVDCFDVVVGNPPFLNRLERATAVGPREAALLAAVLGEAVRPYTDLSALFLLRAVQLCRPGARVALVQPQSLLGARDAGGVRSAILARASLVGLWVSDARLFDAGVRVCVPTLAVGEPEGPAAGGSRSRSVGSSSGPSWSPLVAAHLNLPDVELHPAGTLGEHCTATADFRDQFYGLVPFVVDDPTGDRPEHTFPRLITSGLIDAAACLWGQRTTRFAKRRWRAPRIDLSRLERESQLGRWARARLVPKILLATQTKVVEAVVDQAGTWLPGVPVVTVQADHDRLWHVAAALLSPPLSAWALRQFAGSSLSADAIKLSARQVTALPAPWPGSAWDEAAALVAEASRQPGGVGGHGRRRALLREAAERMCEAYRVSSPGPILSWWATCTDGTRAC